MVVSLVLDRSRGGVGVRRLDRHSRLRRYVIVRGGESTGSLKKNEVRVQVGIESDRKQGLEALSTAGEPVDSVKAVVTLEHERTVRVEDFAGTESVQVSQTMPQRAVQRCPSTGK